MERICVTVFIWCSCLQLFAQEQEQSVVDHANKYMQESGAFSALYYGNEYEGYPRTKNHPFLKDLQYAKVQLSYQNVVYPDVSLRLDVYRGELIVQSPMYHEIVLFPEKVNYAVLHGLFVVYLQKDSLPGCPSDGYYILHYSGKNKVLEKVNALLLEKTSPNHMERFFEFSSHYYILLDGVIYSIKGKKGLLKVLHPYKKELSQYISSRKLSFRKDKEQFLISTVSEYERISK